MRERSTDPLRRLPFRLRPLPDEPFDSWLEAYAHGYGASVAELGLSLGLIHPAVSTQSTPVVTNSWATTLTSMQLDSLEETTGFPRRAFIEMTRMNFAAAAVRLTSTGRISASCAGSGVAGRFCPECLRDSGGRWRLSWQFAFGFACLRHRILLVDVCPQCGQNPRKLGHPIAQVPKPGRCHNPVRDATGQSRCGADLTQNADPIAAPAIVRDAQRTILHVISRGSARFGLYSADPQPALLVMEDFRLLNKLTRAKFRVDASALAQAELGDDLSGRFLALRASDAERRSVHPANAVLAAVGNAGAYRAISDPTELPALLADRLPRTMSTSGYSRPLAQLIDASLGRRHRPSTTLRAAVAGVATRPEDRARKVPALLWPAWTEKLAPNRLDREVAASALAASVLLVGSDLTHGAALRLLDPESPGRRVSHLMTTLGRSRAEGRSIGAIVELADYLDRTDAPIDYSRRRALDYSALLPEREWQDLCEEEGVNAGSGRRWRAARHALFALVTGSRVDAAPFPDSLTGQARAMARDFLARAPVRVRQALEGVAVAFLQANNIDEPLIWAPPTPDAPETVSESDVPVVEKPWARARPGADRLAETLPSERLTAAYEAGRSTRELAVEGNVARQTVARALERAGTPARPPGRNKRIDIDNDWLRQRYVQEHATIPELAVEIGCSSQSVSRFLERAGIPARRRGSASRADSLRPHPIAKDSALLRRALIGQGARQRAQRFLFACDYATLTGAARALEISPATLTTQMRLLGTASGGDLFVSAQRGQPMRLTETGRRLKRELLKARSEHPELWGEDGA